MFLRCHRKTVKGASYDYWSLCESVRTATGPRQRVVATLGKLAAQAMLASLRDNRAVAVKAEQNFELIMKQLEEWNEKWAEARRLATAKLNELLERLRGYPCGSVTHYEETRELVFTEIERLEL